MCTPLKSQQEKREKVPREELVVFLEVSRLSIPRPANNSG